jgi:ribosomal protein S27E
MGYPTQRGIRLFCVSCGRSTEVATAPAKPGRCTHCGGTMLTEHLA